MAERVGFEPTDVENTSPVFKTGSISRSDTSPNFSSRRSACWAERREESSDCREVYHTSGPFVNRYLKKVFKLRRKSAKKSVQNRMRRFP